jgi:hypothetical protein
MTRKDKTEHLLESDCSLLRCGKRSKRAAPLDALMNALLLHEFSMFFPEEKITKTTLEPLNGLSKSWAMIGEAIFAAYCSTDRRHPLH